MDNHTLLACTNALYVSLPKANLTEATFKELGYAVKLGTSFDRLSRPLKACLMVLARTYHETLEQVEVAAALSNTEEAPPEENSDESQSPAPPTPIEDVPPTDDGPPDPPFSEGVPSPAIPDEISAPAKGA